jgi:DNA repair protein RecO (recombination protein O)
MNNFQDQGIIVNVRAHGESGAIASVLTENQGKWNGYVNGGRSSSRLRALLQMGQNVQVEWQSKAEGQLGRFDLDGDANITAKIMHDQGALLAVQSACSLIDRFLPEGEGHSGLYHGTVALIDIMGGDKWAPAYIMWEMAFLKELGYGIDLSKCAVTGVVENLTHVSPKSGRAVCCEEAEPYAHKLLEIPDFLQGKELKQDDIEKGLELTGYFLIHRLLQQSSYQTLPDARMSLENMFNPSKIT